MTGQYDWNRGPTFGKGMRKRMKKTKTFFCLKAAVIILGPCEQLAVALQNPNYTASGAKESIGVLLKSVATLRSESAFQRIWKDAEVEAKNLGLKMSNPKRQKKNPQR